MFEAGLDFLRRLARQVPQAKECRVDAGAVLQFLCLKLMDAVFEFLQQVKGVVVHVRKNLTAQAWERVDFSARSEAAGSEAAGLRARLLGSRRAVDLRGIFVPAESRDREVAGRLACGLFLLCRRILCSGESNKAAAMWASIAAAAFFCSGCAGGVTRSVSIGVSDAQGRSANLAYSWTRAAEGFDAETRGDGKEIAR